MPTKREIFSRNLSREVEKSHLQKQQLAELCGVSKGSFSDWCNGRAYPRPEKMERLATVLGTSEHDLITDRDGAEERPIITGGLAKIAAELNDNPDARALYVAITKLTEEDKLTVRRLVFSLSQNK